MTDPEVHEIIVGAVTTWAGQDYDEDSISHIAHAVVGALATSGYAIVRVDADVVRRVLVEMAKERESKR
ncbi:MAG: hypothetical protein ABL864_00915 [Terricaulis sp.]